jgi:hypothetical protein
VSVYSVPLKEPEPYDTDTDLPVLLPVEPAENFVLAPTQVFEEPVSTMSCRDTVSAPPPTLVLTRSSHRTSGYPL